MSVYNAITQIAWSYSILILFWFITSFLQSSVVTTANNSFSSWFAWHYFAILERHYPSLMIPQYIFCRPSFVSVYSTPPPTTNPYNNKKRTYASALSNTTHTIQPNTISPTTASDLTTERSSLIEKLLAQLTEKYATLEASQTTMQAAQTTLQVQVELYLG